MALVFCHFKVAVKQSGPAYVWPTLYVYFISA